MLPRPPRFAVLGALLACAACGGAAPPHTAAPLDGSPPVGAPAGSPRDDWTTFAHDQLRSGYQPQRTGITKADVKHLALRWRFDMDESLQASPLVADGSVYVVSSTGTAYALDAATGKPRWKRATGATVAMTPALARGLLFVGDHREGGRLYALDATTGTVRWRSAPIPGGIHSEPAVVGATVYVGETTGDPPMCHQGGVYALDANTGKERWKFAVDVHPHEGGAVWSPISFDGRRLFFGSGNTCETGIDRADSVIALDPNGTVDWFYNTAQSISDSDVGGGTMLLHGHAIVASKNGNLYDLDETSGAVNWSTKLGDLPGYGPVGTPSTDGKTIVMTAGFMNDPTTTHWKPPGGELVGLDTAGTILWTLHCDYPVSGSVSMAGGVGFTPVDVAFEALDVRTGAVLWKYPEGQFAYASPAVVPSGVYFADNSGRVFAFALPRSARG